MVASEQQGSSQQSSSVLTDWLESCTVLNASIFLPVLFLCLQYLSISETDRTNQRCSCVPPPEKGTNSINGQSCIWKAVLFCHYICPSSFWILLEWLEQTPNIGSKSRQVKSFFFFIVTQCCWFFVPNIWDGVYSPWVWFTRLLFPPISNVKHIVEVGEVLSSWVIPPVMCLYRCVWSQLSTRGLLSHKETVMNSSINLTLPCFFIFFFPRLLMCWIWFLSSELIQSITLLQRFKCRM